MKGARPLLRGLDARLLPYVTRYRRGLVWGVTCVALTNVIALAQPQVLRFAIDDLYRGVTAEKLGRYAIILFAIALTAAVFKYWMRQSVIAISRHIEYDLRNDLFAHLQRLSVSYFQHARTGEIMSRATNDVSAVRMMLGPGIMYLVNTAVVAVVSIGFMLSISPRIALYALAPLPLVSLCAWFFGERIHRRFEEIQAQFAMLSAKVQENLAGVRVVRAFTRERGESDEFRDLNRDYLDKNLQLIRTSGLFYPALAFLSGTAALLALYLGGREVIATHITLGQFVAFTWYLGMLNWPMVALGWVINLFQRGVASFGRLEQLLEVEPAIVSAPDAVRPASCRGEIEFRDLTFHYPGVAAPALEHISFRVRAGQTVALVGRTGSGKSTLLALLPRVFDPPPGAVLLDGHDVRDVDVAWLRAQIACTPQETFLFSATLAENVAYGAADASDDAIRRAASIAGLDSDVSGFPDGFETRVGERGITLSGGQKQRTAIARAVLRDAPLLVLDDCLSSVDTHTEDAILHGLRGEMRGRTTLLVSHRVSTVRDADLIVVLDAGRVVEQGTHAELMAAGGAYAELSRSQQLEEELEAS
ncbi:MAG TPA: ABC transporter ATP-binding protein [Candidatus Saccharimonadaceae bacterium]|nr:ABC transporter ATP-binding protein [Candidatus Saccharimonadaceae bacterium]